MKTSKTRFTGCVIALSMSAAAICSTGCQYQVGGQTLPSGYYLSDDVQYFPAGPEFQLSNEAAAMDLLNAEAQR